MAAVTIHGDFGASPNPQKKKKKKSVIVSKCFPLYLPWSDGTEGHDLRFLNGEFQANFFTLLFHLHQEAL